jgi:hypothetical protein
VYGLVFAYMELGDIEPAQKHFQAVLEMEAPEELRGLVRNGLREIAVRGLKARGRGWMRSSKLFKNVESINSCRIIIFAYM